MGRGRTTKPALARALCVPATRLDGAILDPHFPADTPLVPTVPALPSLGSPEAALAHAAIKAFHSRLRKSASAAPPAGDVLGHKAARYY